MKNVYPVPSTWMSSTWMSISWMSGSVLGDPAVLRWMPKTL